MIRAAVLTAVDVAHTAGHDPSPVRDLLAERIGGDPVRADEVTVAAVFADVQGVERGRIGGWFDGVGW